MGYLSAVLLVCGLPILGITLFRLYKLSVNYREAKKFGIPIKIVPFNRQDDLWLFLWRHFHPLIKALPFGWGSWVDYSAHGWNVNIRWKEHEDLGDCFVLVTPNQNEIVFTDPVAGLELESKYKTWFKPQHHYYIFNLFGRNLLTVNGDEWQRHRKITSPVFRELTYKLVWSEALRQADQMFRVASQRVRLDQRGSNYMEDIKKDAMIFAMHVLSAVAFGHKHDFERGLRQVPPGHAVSFSGVMWFIFEKFLRVVMFRSLHLPAWLAPRWLTDIHLHLFEFEQYAQESIDRQRKAGPSPIGSGADMVSALIAANEIVKNEEKSISTPAGRRSYLDDSELFGNMFIFNLVGFEPPFNAVIHVIPFLAAHSDVQEWAREEVDAVLKQENIESYEDVFPKLVRCQAVLVLPPLLCRLGACH
jgi:cytochrome P450